MDIRNCYLFGTDIDLSKYGLGKIYQPRYRDFLNLGIDYFEFVKVFYFGEVFSHMYEKEIKTLGVIPFFIMVDLENKEDKLIDSLLYSLKTLYQTDNVRFVDHMATFVVDESIVIDKDNFSRLSDVVIEMTKTVIDYESIAKKKLSNDEILNEFEKRKREYEEKHNSKKSDISFVDVLNVVIHYQPNVSYIDVLDWTIYQIKNSYEVLLSKEHNYISVFRQASMKFDVPEIVSWQSKAKLNKTKISM